MSDPIPYYRLCKFHKEIFKTDEPCSFFELLFTVEAPQFLSKLNIFDYVEKISVDKLTMYYPKNDNKDSLERKNYNLTKSENERYPYYELFLALQQNQQFNPLIFKKREDKDETLECIEGRHRLRMAILCSLNESKMYEVSCVIAKEIEKRSAIRYPALYQEWLDYRHENSFINKIYNLRTKYAEFIRKE